MSSNTINSAWLGHHLPGIAVSTAVQDLSSYGTDWSKVRDPAPTAVLFPQHAEQVQQIVVCARKY
nr:hypothetical protein [Gammaproteobacteria bacterium]